VEKCQLLSKVSEFRLQYDGSNGNELAVSFPLDSSPNEYNDHWRLCALSSLGFNSIQKESCRDTHLKRPSLPDGRFR
jgi:hypothetical protein